MIAMLTRDDRDPHVWPTCPPPVAMGTLTCGPCLPEVWPTYAVRAATAILFREPTHGQTPPRRSRCVRMAWSCIDPSRPSCDPRDGRSSPVGGHLRPRRSPRQTTAWAMRRDRVGRSSGSLGHTRPSHRPLVCTVWAAREPRMGHVSPPRSPLVRTAILTREHRDPHSSGSRSARSIPIPRAKAATKSASSVS
jgi:hypothetical protein